MLVRLLIKSSIKPFSSLTNLLQIRKCTSDIVNNVDNIKTKGRKIIKLRSNRPIIQKQRATNEAHELKAKELGLSWRIIGATILHRYPTITPDVAEWESNMWDMQDKIEEKQREWFMEEVGGTDAQIIPDTNPSVQEILDSMPFQPASRITDADISNDRHSLERKLPKSLYLIVKRNRNDNPWQFPQGKMKDEESSLREVSERVIDRAIGKTKRWFISNAPIGHYCYAYPEEMQKKRNEYGAKIYFYRAQIILGNVKLETRLYTDYAWIDRDEVVEYFNEDMGNYLKALLPE